MVDYDELLYPIENEPDYAPDVTDLLKAEREHIDMEAAAVAAFARDRMERLTSPHPALDPELRSRINVVVEEIHDAVRAVALEYRRGGV